jgi:iron complex outermembrane receptor protein
MKSRHFKLINKSPLSLLIILFFFLWPAFIYAMPANNNTLSGKITDNTNRTLPGAVIQIPDLKTGAVADSNGNYLIENLPTGKFTVIVTMISYDTSIKHVTITGATKLNFTLKTASENVQEVVITAMGVKTTNIRSPMPVTVVSHDMLTQNTATNVIDAIALQPGMNEVTTGPGISKPEINGLGFSRVLTLFDGERQEDFQWGDEHGILIDPYAVYNAEIIRGPASLQYGANAEAGVVSFKSQPSTEPGTIQGSVLTEYQTNDGLIGGSFNIGGNNKGFVWDLRASNEQAHCYTDPKDGYVWGTASSQQNIRGTLGVDKDWGFSHLSVSILHRVAEIPDGNRDSATGAFEFDVPQPIGGHNPQYYTGANAPSPALIGTLVPGTGQVYPTRVDFLSYNAERTSVYQVLDHDALWWQNSFNVGRGRIGADIGYTQSQRQEIDTGTVAAENMTVRDIPYSFKYQIEGDTSGLKFTTGINGIYEFEQNAPEPPAPYIGDFEIPDYHDFDIGGYAILQKDYKHLTLSGGLRYDLRTMVGNPMYLANYATPQQQQVPAGTPGTVTQFPNFNRTFTGTSASFGASYLLPKHNYIKLNFAKSFRAPSISELTSNELDPANIFRLGDANLKPESGYEADIAYGNNGRDISFEVDGFANYIQNFIFPTKLASVNGGDSLQLGAPVYKYGAASAIIAGVSAYFNIHPVNTKWLEIRNGFTYIYSYLPNQTDTTDHVPFTPAPRLTSEIKFKLADRPHSILKGTYIQLGAEHDWAQNNIYSADWNELPSIAYTLYNAGIGTNFVSKKSHRTVASLFINCTNLMNLAYVDHTSRPQYFWAYNGAYAGLANNGLTSAIVTQPSQGIYNMGRNVGIKLIFPFGSHKVSDTELQGTDAN